MNSFCKHQIFLIVSCLDSVVIWNFWIYLLKLDAVVLFIDITPAKAKLKYISNLRFTVVSSFSN